MAEIVRDRRIPQVTYISEAKKTVDPVTAFAERVRNSGQRSVRVVLEARDKPVVSPIGSGKPSPEEVFYAAVLTSGMAITRVDLGSERSTNNSPWRRHFVPGEYSKGELRALAKATDEASRLQDNLGQKVDVAGPLRQMKNFERQLVVNQINAVNKAAAE